MEFKRIGVDNFIPVSSLFPGWPRARVVLTAKLDLINDWKITQVNSSLLLRTLTPEEICKNVPDEHICLVSDIVAKAENDYLPDFSDLFHDKITGSLLSEVASRILSFEASIILGGGRDFKTELAYRLGLEDGV